MCSNYILLKAKIGTVAKYSVWFSHSDFFSLLHLSVERQEAQSAGIKATRRQRLSADSGVMETTNLVTSSKTCLRQSTKYRG